MTVMLFEKEGPPALTTCGEEHAVSARGRQSRSDKETGDVLTTLVLSTLTPFSSISIAPPTSLIICDKLDSSATKNEQADRGKGKGRRRTGSA